MVPRTPRRVKNVPKNCPFCKNDTLPSYKEVEILRQYTSERGKILAHMRTGICSKHQRRITKHVKYARHLALLPFMLRPV